MDETYVNDALYQKLKTFQPWNEQEAADQRVMLAYMEQFPDIYNRENVFAHMTSSPWIMNHTKDKVLMIYHNIYKSWAWTGGHADGDADLHHVAQKEVMEESGLTHVKFLSDEPFSIRNFVCGRSYEKRTLCFYASSFKCDVSDGGRPGRCCAESSRGK